MRLALGEETEVAAEELEGSVAPRDPGVVHLVRVALGSLNEPAYTAWISMTEYALSRGRCTELCLLQYQTVNPARKALSTASFLFKIQPLGPRGSCFCVCPMQPLRFVLIAGCGQDSFCKSRGVSSRFQRNLCTKHDPPPPTPARKEPLLS